MVVKSCARPLIVTFLFSAGFLRAQFGNLPIVSSVVNGASYERGVTRGGIVSIFGLRLARSTVIATSLPLPRRLEDTVVRVGDLGIEAPLYFVSPGQINALLPFEALGDTIPIDVITAEGKSPFTFVLRPNTAGPGIFTSTSDGKGRPLVLDSAFQRVQTVQPGVPVLFYATGLGPTNPPLLTGEPAALAEPLNRVLETPEVFIGDSPARVIYAGLAPGFAGVYQLNVVPEAMVSNRVWIRAGGRSSNVTEIATGRQPGQNVTNATGAIEVLTPSGDLNNYPVGFTPHVVVARITAQFDIASNARPFSLIATTESTGGVVVSFDPASGRFEGTATVPQLSARRYDFSAAPFFLTDLLSCILAECQLFPGNVIPLSRVAPWERAAIDALPISESPNAGGVIGVVRTSGRAAPGSTFRIGAQDNVALSLFAGYVTIPIPAPRVHVTRLRLYVDGREVASKDLSYRAGS